MWPEQSPSAPATTTKRKRVPDANRPTVKCNECQQMVANYSTSFIHHVNVKYVASKYGSREWRNFGEQTSV